MGPQAARLRYSSCRGCRQPPQLPPVFYILLVVSFTWLSSASADEIKLEQGDDFIQAISESLHNVNTKQLQQLIAGEPQLELIDVRTADEIAALGGMIDPGHQPRNINRGWLEFRIREAVPDKSTPIVVYCGINQRSPLAAHTLMQMGYSNVYNYADGFFAWQEAGLPVRLTDQAPGSMLYSLPRELSDGIWSATGATAAPSYENSGHNNNLSFIITDEGVVVVNAGDNYLLAQALHREIKARTSQPVKYVILENGQGHAMLGTSYWQSQGATVIAHVEAVGEIEEKGEAILERMQLRNRDKAMGTELALPDESFADRKLLTLGGVQIEILNLGTAHSPGDIVVWLPQRRIVIAGDIAFHQRLLPVFEDTDTAAWIETWAEFAALEAEIVVPGHGEPTTMTEVEKYTVGYLRFMRQAIGKILDEGGSLIDAYKIDQSGYRHLDTFNELAGLNADRIYRAMEFE